jgi:hypothetical protein
MEQEAMPNQDSPQQLDDCIKACAEALQACEACAAADIQADADSMARCALINMDCADICAATLRALARRSPHHGDFCAICAHICRACADECAKHKHEHCVRCKEACQRCASACAKHASESHVH